MKARSLRRSLIACSVLFFATGLSAQRTELDPDILMRESMVVMARQLGVTCTHCHDPKNFKAAGMRTFQVAKQHMRVTHLLNSKEGFAGKPKVDCYTCHRGEAVPAYKEPIAKGKEKKH